MSDPESFLTRWSRRKLEAEEERPAEQTAEPKTVAVPESPTPAAAEDDRPTPARAVESEAPAVDLSALPSIEEITAETDIRAFLQPGIPLQLTRAALRRVWTADPAIRDFVGLAENAWDFTAPDGVPGFGPLTPNDIARQAAAQVAGQAPSAVSPPSRPVTEPLQNPDVSTPRDAPRLPAAVQDTSASDAAAPEQDQQSDDDAAMQSDAAMQKEQAADDRKTSVAARHGGALPR